MHLLVAEGDRLTAVEAKSAATVATDFFTALKRFGADVEARLPHLGYEARVVYGGEKGQDRSSMTVVRWQHVQGERW